jgi:PleD family two-component response regulator
MAVADQINSVVKRPTDFVARWGGEEFIYAAFIRRREIEAIAEI